MKPLDIIISVDGDVGDLTPTEGNRFDGTLSVVRTQPRRRPSKPVADVGSLSTLVPAHELVLGRH